MRKLVFALVLLSFSALSGDRMGNGGDVRRYRVYRSTEFLVNVFMMQDVTVYDGGPGGPWFRMYQGGLRQTIEQSHYVWVDQHSNPANARNCLDMISVGKNLFNFEFSYQACPARTIENGYVDLLIKTLIRYYSPDDTDFANRVGAFYAAAAAEKLHTEGTVGKSDDKRIRQPIPESALGDVTLMEGYLARARSVAIHEFQFDSDMSLASFIEIYGKNMGTFLKQNNAQIINELRNSPVKWDATQLSCSFTELKPLAAFELALGHCRELKSVFDLAWLITHESMHHFGITDESQADRVANRMVDMGYWYETE
jgi:hypothetical protein